MRRYRGRIGRVYALACSPDGSKVASAGSHGLNLLWDAARGRPILRWREDLAVIYDLAFSPDGATLGAVAGYLDMTLWSIPDARPLGSLLDPSDGAKSLDFRPDGKALLTAGSTGSAVVRDLESRSTIARFRARVVIQRARYSPDGSRIALATDGPIYLWDPVRLPDVEAPDPRASPFGGGDDQDGLRTIRQVPSSRRLAFSPDGRFLASTVGWSISLREMPDGRPGPILKGHVGQVRDVAFSPDGRTLASVGADRMLRLWSMPDGRERACLDWGGKILECVAFSPDGSTVLAAGDGGIVVWDVE